VNNGRNDWDSDEDWNDNYGWDSDVEYKMTAGGLERSDKKVKTVDESQNDNNNSNQEALDNYKKSKEELKKEYEKKQKEAEDLKKELDKPIDSTQYHYKKATVIAPPAPTASNTQLEDILDSHILLMQMVL
jgi:molecular chaperone GrpE (heat shock protein)